MVEANMCMNHGLRSSRKSQYDVILPPSSPPRDGDLNPWLISRPLHPLFLVYSTTQQVPIVLIVRIGVPSRRTIDYKGPRLVHIFS